MRAVAPGREEGTMSLASRWRRWFEDSCSPKVSRMRQRSQSPLRSSRLALQPLEDRRLLSAIPVGPEFQVNTYTVRSQLNASVAMDADGDFVVAWSSLPSNVLGGGDGQDGSYSGVFAQRYNAAGEPQGDEFRVNTHTTNSQTRPDVAMNAAGDFVIAWEGFHQPGGERLDVYAQRYNAAGEPQGDEFRVNTRTAGHQSEASVALDAAGNYVIGWQSFPAVDFSGDLGIYARRYNTAGEPQGDEFLVNTLSAGTLRIPDVAVDTDGDFVIVWPGDPDSAG